MVALAMWRLTTNRTATDRDVSRELRARLREQQKLKEELAALLGDLEQAAARISSDVEQRFARLETLIRVADERIKAAAGATQTARSANDPATVDARPAAGTTQTPPRIAEKTRCASDVEFAPATHAASELHELVGRGLSPMQAAQQLQLPLGEVELMLRLRSYAGGDSSAPPAHANTAR